LFISPSGGQPRFIEYDYISNLIANFDGTSKISNLTSEVQQGRAINRPFLRQFRLIETSALDCKRKRKQTKVDLTYELRGQNDDGKEHSARRM
jgi:hypothetical protein